LPLLACPAEAYTAFITDFVARHEKAAAELGDARQINGAARAVLTVNVTVSCATAVVLLLKC
jgi:hypothetical protein